MGSFDVQEPQMFKMSTPKKGWRKQRRACPIITTDSDDFSLSKADMTTEHNYHFLNRLRLVTDIYPVVNSPGQVVNRAKRLQLCR